jgi:glycosyltransferase involved in cell wall biosynthesis
VFHLAETSGPSISLFNDLAWLARGGTLDVAVPARGRVAERYAPFAELTALGHSALTLPGGPRDAGRFAARLARDASVFRRHIRRTRPDRVVAVTTVLPALMVAARAERVPLLVYAAELVPTAPGAARRLGGRLLVRVTRSLADAVVCCSTTVAKQFEGPGGPFVTVAYPPVADDLGGGDGSGLRRRFGIAPDATCVAVVGSISRGRGLDVLVRALPGLRERFPGVRLLVVGEPHPRGADRDYLSDVRRLAAELGVLDVLVFAGFVEAVADVYAAAAVVVNPARREGFGRVAVEALSAGRPVVATTAGAIPEVLRDGVDGLLVPPDDPAALRRALERILGDPELAARLAASGAARVRSEFSVERRLARFAAGVAAVDARARTRAR